MRRSHPAAAVVTFLVLSGGLIYHWSGRSPDAKPTDGHLGAESTPRAEEGDGELVTPGRAADLGLIRQPADQPFVYRNRGRSPVTITAVRPSCNCVVTMPDKTVLGPGEEGRIVARVDPARQPVGRHAHVIEVDYKGNTP